MGDFMFDLKQLFVRRLLLFAFCLIVCFCTCITLVKNRLYDNFFEYAEYHCSNVLYAILNAVIEEQVNVQIMETAILESSGNVITIDYNVEMINSIVCNVVNRTLSIVHRLQNGVKDDLILSGYEDIVNESLLYYVPLGMVFENYLIAYLGVNLPIKYQIVGKLKGEVISSVQEYGVNNALIEIKLCVSGKTNVLIPLMTKEVDISLEVPLVIKIIQGEVPDYYLGEKVLGGIN